MIDIHAHLLPGVDDGPESMEESFAMLQKGFADGISGVICTPHVVDWLNEEMERDFIQKFRALNKMIKKEEMAISLWLGSEIHYYAKYNHESKLSTLNGKGKYILLELPFTEVPKDVGETIFRIVLERKTPVIAHPERNTMIIQKPKLAYELVQHGVLLQINAGSLTGDFGRTVKRVAFDFMDHHMVHFVASDCHNPNSRPMILSKAYRMVLKHWGMERAEKLFQENPMMVIRGERISPPEPIPFDEANRKRTNRFKLRLFRK